MAYTNSNWACISSSLNKGQETVTPFGGVPTVVNAPNLFLYGSPVDTVAVISAANYFLPEYASLSVGDWILGFGTDASFALQVTAVSSTAVTVMSVGLTSSIGTANIVDHAVTYPKIQQVAASSLLGNATVGVANVEEITLASSLAFNGTVLGLAPLYDNYVEVNMTAAQWNGMYATPVQLVAAPGANKMVLVNKVAINLLFGTTQFTGGGVVGLQYGASAHLAGNLASVTEAAADFTGAAASTMFRLGGGLNTGALLSNAANAAVSISNQTGAFATGDSTFKVQVWYSVIPTN